MHRFALALAPAALLAACATPQQRCIAEATQNLTVVNQLVAQLELDIERGYGVKQTQVVTPMWRPCYRHDGWIEPDHHGRPYFGGPQMCLEDTVRTVNTPVAIDLADAKRKLASLKQKQAELNHQAGPAIAQCQALYPQTN